MSDKQIYCFFGKPQDTIVGAPVSVPNVTAGAYLTRRNVETTRIGFVRSSEIKLHNPNDDWLSAAYKKLKSFEGLHQDGDREPPNGWARFMARNVVDVAQLVSARKFLVSASVDGGVAVCFVRGDRYADIECLNSGKVLAVTSQRDKSSQVWKVGHDQQSLQHALKLIGAFLGD
jgi:hypothetical protein